MKELYKFFKFNEKVVDIHNYDAKNLEIRSRDIVQKIKNGEDGWQSSLPQGVAEMIETYATLAGRKNKRNRLKFLRISAYFLSGK